MIVLTILCAESAVIRKKWNAEEAEVDDGRMNVYKKTLLFYNGAKMQKKTELMNILKDINPIDWDILMRSKMFNNYSDSSS